MIQFDIFFACDPSREKLKINKRSLSNKRVALGKNPKINNRKAYYFLIGKSKTRIWNPRKRIRTAFL